MNIIRIAETPSTNSTLAAMDASSPLAHGTVLVATAQSAGRGQRGASWESEPGRNITMSVLLRPCAIECSRQFVISEIVSVAVTGVLQRHMPGTPVRIKWPNDIYAADGKICGILIENTVHGRCIERSIAGMGINVNQHRFLSDAPNPVSIVNITGRELSLDSLLDDICLAIEREWEAATAGPEGAAELHERYIGLMWRRPGFYPYRDAASGDIFEAAIAHVAPTGHITLRERSGRLRTYAFKEVAAIL